MHSARGGHSIGRLHGAEVKLVPAFSVSQHRAKSTKRSTPSRFLAVAPSRAPSSALFHPNFYIRRTISTAARFCAQKLPPNSPARPSRAGRRSRRWCSRVASRAQGRRAPSLPRCRSLVRVCSELAVAPGVLGFLADLAVRRSGASRTAAAQEDVRVPSSPDLQLIPGAAARSLSRALQLVGKARHAVFSERRPLRGTRSTQPLL